MASNQQLQILQEDVSSRVQGKTIIVVKTAWNAVIVDELERGVQEVCKANGVNVKTITVPGAVEIPFTIHYHNSLANIAAPDAYIALGCVIKGDTPHFEYVCQSITQGITLLNVQINKPVIFGVLTLNTEQQALDRLGGPHGHKGKEAAETALSMIAMMQKVNGK